MTTRNTVGPGVSDGARYGRLAAVCLAALMIPLAFTGPAVSAPAIKADLGGSVVALNWVVNAWMLTFAASVMATGALADLIGRKRCFLTGVGGFIVISALIGLAPSVLVLDLLRGVQGVFGAMILTSGTALLAQDFHGTERARAFSLLGTTFGVGLAFGPLIAGTLIELASWRALFFALSAVTVLVFLVGVLEVSESKDPDARGIDWIGTITFTGSLALLTFGIVQGPQNGWGSPIMIGLFAGCAALLVAFVIGERRQERPMLDLSLFKYPRFIGVQMLPIATGFGFVALLVYLPLWFIGIYGMTEVEAGIAALPITAPILVVPFLAGYLARWISPSILSGVGLTGVAAGCLWLTVMSPGGGPESMILPMLLIGVGTGLPWGLQDGLSVSVVPPERAGMASGIFTTSRVASEVIAIAAIGATLVSMTAATLAGAVDAGTLTGAASPGTLANTVASGSLAEAAAMAPAGQQELYATVIGEAYANAFDFVLYGLTAIAIVSALICFLTLRNPYEAVQAEGEPVTGSAD